MPFKIYFSFLLTVDVLMGRGGGGEGEARRREKGRGEGDGQKAIYISLRGDIILYCIADLD